MHDLGWFRANLDTVAARLATRGTVLPLDEFRDLDRRRRAAITEAEQLRAGQNQLSREVPRLRKEGVDTTELQQRSREMGDRVSELNNLVEEVDSQFRDMLAGIPNLPHESVPVGKSADDNVVVRTSGEPPVFDFEPKAHWDLGPQLGILDFDRAAKITGARFAVYWDLGAKLERALINFMLDTHSREHGYTEVLPPYLVNAESMYGTGQLPKFEEDLFKVPHNERSLYLIPTAEVPVTNIFRDEILEASRLPVSLTAYTPCWRSEAGAYGKDVRGIIRQHQFQKVELVKFAKPEQSYEEHEKLTRAAEDVLERLGLHYRRMLLCTGDMGFSSAKTYDLEVWLPGQGLFREISSCSNFESFQARRANIRYKIEGKKGTELVHTLNGSGLAVGRTWVAIVENYQQADGSVVIPKVLRPYIGTDRIEARKM